MNKNDWILVVWLILDMIKDIIFLVGSVYLVLWKGCSGWWIVLALILMPSPTLYSCLKKRYGVNEEE